jgi:hypothetical protein
VRYSFKFNRKSDRLARQQLYWKVEELPLDSHLQVTCNMQAEYLGLCGFPTTDEVIWLRPDIRYLWVASHHHPDEWAREWREQEKYLRQTYV